MSSEPNKDTPGPLYSDDGHDDLWTEVYKNMINEPEHGMTDVKYIAEQLEKIDDMKKKISKIITDLAIFEDVLYEMRNNIKKFMKDKYVE